MTAMLPALKKAARKGRDGDTMIAHINEAEAAALRAMGGSGTRNPRTGLLEFKYGADTNEGGAHGFSGGGSGKGTAGGNGGYWGGDGKKYGPNTGLGGLSDSDVTQNATGWGSNSNPRGPTIERVTRSEPFAPSGPNARWGFTPNTPQDLQKRQDDYNSAWDDKVNRGFGGWLRDKLLDAIPGFRQEDPNWNDPATYRGGIYHDSWSPWGAAASIASMASPIPGTGIIAGAAANSAADALGADRYVFGGGGWGPAQPEPGPTTGPIAQGKEDALKAEQQGGLSGGKGTASGTALLPPVVGNPAVASAQAPAVPTGTTVPPAAAAPQIYPGGFMPVAGPAPYGWTRPTWSF